MCSHHWTAAIRIGIAVLFLSLGLSCERSYGVKRRAQLSRFPDPACVRAVVEGVPGIQDYDEFHWPEEEGQEGRRSHNFFYNGSAVKGVQLGLFDDGDPGIRFIQTYLPRNKPLQANVDEARRLMKAVEEGLASRCGIPDLNERIRESCPGVECRERVALE